MSANFWKWVLFSFNGRITRTYYWLVWLAFVVIEMIIFGVFFGRNINALASGDISAVSPIAALFALLLSILPIWIGFAVAIKRWQIAPRAAGGS